MSDAKKKKRISFVRSSSEAIRKTLRRRSQKEKGRNAGGEKGTHSIRTYSDTSQKARDNEKEKSEQDELAILSGLDRPSGHPFAVLTAHGFVVHSKGMKREGSRGSMPYAGKSSIIAAIPSVG